MIIRTLLATVVVAALAVPAANAMTVVNADKSAEAFWFTPKHGKSQHVSLRSNHFITLDCKSGGTLKLSGNHETCSAKTARIWIKKGKFLG